MTTVTKFITVTSNQLELNDEIREVNDLNAKGYILTQTIVHNNKDHSNSLITLVLEAEVETLSPDDRIMFTREGFAAVQRLADESAAALNPRDYDSSMESAPDYGDGDYRPDDYTSELFDSGDSSDIPF